MRTSVRKWCFLAAVCLSSVLPTAQATFIPFEVGGDATRASIQGAVDAFRNAVGNPNNGNALGPLGSGRREINWDGVGGVLTTAPAGTPFPGFQANRGALFTTAGTGFVQATQSGLATTFSNTTYNTIFSTFSDFRLFTPVGSNITDVTFFIPGTTTPATVSGFGAVFTDIDLATSTSLMFFDANNNLLFNDFVSAGIVPDGSLSFLGALGNAGEQIFRVRITTGNSALGPNDGSGVDVVVLDDLIYSEPRALLAVPEPSALALVLTALLGSIGLRRRVAVEKTYRRALRA